jgi:DNA-binding MarR family transcriptional regulator
MPNQTKYEPTDLLILQLRRSIVGMVRSDSADLTMRQLSVLMTCCLSDEPHTVRGLAAYLEVNKAAITRALDRLQHLGLARRKPDPSDKRSVLASPTPQGKALFQRFATTTKD